MQESNEKPEVKLAKGIESDPNNLKFSFLADKAARVKVINEKYQRCNDFKDGIYGKVPFSFQENNPKEELVLEHVLQFESQLKLLYGDRDLFLYPKNECGIYKFICATIRPTKLGYLELYNFKNAAQYISHFIAFEELDPPNKFPEIIPAPSNVAEWQKGDCVDMSILYCSLMIGVGYDAYVVLGKAPREITTKNEGLLPCPIIHKGELQPDPIPPSEIEELKKHNEFVIHERKEIRSEYLRQKEDEIRELEKMKEKEALDINDEEPDEMTDDAFEGQRVHAWVLMKNTKREVEETVFIEPSNGRIFKTNESPYISVDAVFNHKNYWINMETSTPIVDINFNEMNESANWESIMIDTEPVIEEEGQDEGDEYIQETKKEGVELFELSMPSSWSSKIFIDKEAFLRGAPLGEHSDYFYKSRVDNFSNYSQPDGLIQRILIYEDYKRTKLKEMRCFYNHRSDNLILKRTFPFEFLSIEEYKPGKPPHWKQVIEKDRRYRIIKFYPNRNIDGLIMREERIGKKTIEYYDNRDDKVIFRSVSIVPKVEAKIKDYYSFEDNHVGPVIVTKMTQKLDKNPNLPPESQVSKMIIDLTTDKMMVYFHLVEGEIVPRFKELPRIGLMGVSTRGDGEKSVDDPFIQAEKQKMLGLEKDCFQQIKVQEGSANDEKVNLLEKPLFLEKTIHDKARERYKEAMKRKDDGGIEEDPNDPLIPVLKAKGWIKRIITQPLNIHEALEVKNEIMSKFKKRVMTRADIIRKRLEEEKKNLEKKEQILIKKGEHITEEEQRHLEEEMSKLHLKIDILEQRAEQFERRTYDEYESLDKKLNDDARLSVLNQSK